MTSGQREKRTQTRDLQRTRRAILAAASRLMARDGLGVSLGAIASAAGVSRSGLLHHFASRDALIEALHREMVDDVRRSVQSHVDLTENHPGKLLRAYIRAMCDDDEWLASQGERDDLELDWGAWIVLRSIPSTVAAEREDAHRWDAELTADGMDPDRALLIQLATDGLALYAHHDAELAQEYLARMRPLLLRLTEETGPPFP